MTQRGKIEQVRRACIGTPALFAVDSLPVKYQNALYKTHPDLQEQAASREFLDTIEPDGLAMNFYAEYKVEGARGLSFAKQQEYSNNAAILEAFRKWIEKADSQRLRQSYPRIKKTEFGHVPRVPSVGSGTSTPIRCRRIRVVCRKNSTSFFRAANPTTRC